MLLVINKIKWVLLMNMSTTNLIVLPFGPNTYLICIYYYIDACKKAILETIENTDSRKEMVLRLIQLRIRFEDMKERANHASIINNNVETRGHFFVR